MTGQQPPPTSVARPNSWAQRWRVPAVCLVLAAITFAVFGQTLKDKFVDYDDDIYVYENPVVAPGLTLKGIVWAFAGVHAGNWHPLTWLSHMLDCQLYGLNPTGHHLTNVLLHAATVIALFLVLRQMTGAFWRSAFVAAVFAIHPLRVESVAWVAERKDVLSGLFFVLTIGAYIRYARRAWSPGRYGLVMLLFAMGLMCKPMLVTLPVVLLLLDYWPLQRVETRNISGLLMEKLPLLALSAAACVITLLAQHGAMKSTESLSVLYRIGNALVSCMVYLVQMVWPAGLAVFYPYPDNGLPPWEVVLAGALLAGFSAFALWQRRKQPWLLVGWFWFLVMLLPVVGLIQVGRQAYADRYTYLPQIGVYVAITWLAAQWRLNRMLLGTLMAGVLAVLMICAWNQAAYWQDSETLWSHALACTTDNAVAHYNFGIALDQDGRVDEAIAHYQEALKIVPLYAEAHNNLGTALLNTGKVDAGIAQYRQALQMRPDMAETRNNLGNALLKTGKVDEAIAQYQIALQTDPDFAEAHNNLGNALRQEGRRDEAISHYQKALQLRPDYADARNNLGQALLESGKVDEAIAHYQKALQITPGLAGGHNNLGQVLLQKGRVAEAIAQFQDALQLKPDYAEARTGLGEALFQKGSVAEAITQFQSALQLNPGSADGHFNLGLALMEKGGVDEAISQYQEALQLNPGSARGQYILGMALVQKGRWDEAVTHLQKALQLNPENADAHASLGNVLMQMGKVDEAIDQFQKALQIRPDYAQAHNNLGNALLQEGKVDEAIAHLRKAVQLNPGYGLLHNNLGKAFLQKGNMAEAISQFQQALQIGPADSSLQNNLAWLLATSPEASLRNGSQAVELARQANARTGGENPVVLHTLAAALAEAGQYSEAVETAQRALQLARAQSNTNLSGPLQAELKLYQAGSPFHSSEQTH